MTARTWFVEFVIAARGSPPAMKNVFEKFYRALKTGAGGGVGLGLTIARGIISAHGGRLWAENHPDGGALFRFRIPQADPPPSVEPES
ncbi:MAG: ATP-binding protein [Polyangiaceae bacterium]